MDLQFDFLKVLCLFFVDFCGETFLPQMETKDEAKILNLYVFMPQSAW